MTYKFRWSSLSKFNADENKMPTNQFSFTGYVIFVWNKAWSIFAAFLAAFRLSSVLVVKVTSVFSREVFCFCERTRISQRCQYTSGLCAFISHNKTTSTKGADSVHTNIALLRIKWDCFYSIVGVCQKIIFCS